jgi:tRNA threonylcarbamoyladenosine biosynthesis protein TsaB
MRSLAILSIAMILAIDTANTPVSVALADTAGEVLACYVFPAGEQPAATLFPVVARLLAAVGAPFAAVTQLAVCCGPGAFTGIRIGLAAVQGLHLATGCPLVAISTLEAWAMRSAVPVRVCVPDGGGGMVTQDFDAAGCAVTPVQPFSSEQILPAGWAMAGPGRGLPPAPLAGAIALAAARGIGAAAAIAPLYLRPSYAEVAVQHPSRHPR